jgi:hypothetical protein
MMLLSPNRKAFILIATVTLLLTCDAFSPLLHPKNARSQQVGVTSLAKTHPPQSTILRQSSENNNDNEEEEQPKAKKTLEEKMKSWEATEEEVKAATLGGVVPGRSDAFDVGLYIAFPIMVVTGLFFAFFPLFMGNIDVTSVGPPPTL